MLVFSGKVAVKPEATPGSLWVKAAFCGFMGSCSPQGVPCCLGAAWSCQANPAGAGKPYPLLPNCSGLCGENCRAAWLVLFVAKHCVALLQLPPWLLCWWFKPAQPRRERDECSPQGAFYAGWEGEILCDRPHTAKEKDPTAFLSLFYSLPA